MDAIIKKYKTLSQIPALVGARIYEKQAIINVATVWSQRNYEEEVTTKFTKNFFLSPDLKLLGETFPVDQTKELLSTHSKTEKYRAALIKNGEGSQFISIWKNQSLFRNVALKDSEIHGDVYADGEFANFEFSPDETRLLFVAEKKIPKRITLNKRKTAKDEEKNNKDTPRESAEEFIQDWGEQLVGKKKSVLVQYNIDKDEVELVKLTDDEITNRQCMAQPTWSPDGSYIVGLAYKTEPRKLGLIYCSNRENILFKLEHDGTFTELEGEGKSIKNPRFSPDGSVLVWLQRATNGPHHACMQLVKMNTNLQSKPEIVVDIVQTSQLTTNEKLFYGLYCVNFTRRFWANDNKRIILSTSQRNTVNTYCINIETNAITELEYSNGSQVLLDVHNDMIVVSRRNALMPDVLAIGKLPASGQEAEIQWMELTEINSIDGLENCMYKYFTLKQDTSNAVQEFTSIYVGPKSGNKNSVPLLLWPHGGPHSAFANGLALEPTVLLSMGYAILLVNYRGSVGAGQASVDSLPGHCGSHDVSDCLLALKEALSQMSWLDEARVALIGGSHGGFLVTHLAGQTPDKWRAVVTRNPVIDVASMSVVSDIPDWCYVETGYEYTQLGPVSEDILLAMRRCSPILHAHKVKAPTLLQVGLKDLRVPPSQAKEFYHILKANGTPVKMNVYDDNHPLSSVVVEMEDIVSTILWLEEHMNK